MEELVRPWRDAYRQHDPSFFQGKLYEVPELPKLENTLNHTTLLPVQADKALLYPLKADLDELTVLLRQDNDHQNLIEISDIEALDGSTPQKAWCSDFEWRRPRSRSASSPSSEQDMAITKDVPNDASRIRLPATSATIRRSLIALLSGYESESFAWDTTEKTFVYRDSDLRLPDISTAASQALIRPCLDRGTCFRRLQLAQEHLTNYESQFSPTFIQVKVFLREYLDLCHESIPLALRQDIHGSIMSIPYWAEPTTDALKWLCTLLNIDKDVNIEEALTQLSATEILNCVEQEVRDQVGVTTSRDQVARELLHRITKPLMHEIASITGLGPRLTTEREFLKNVHSNTKPTDGKAVCHDSPDILEPSQVKSISEVARGVKFLELYSDNKMGGELCTMQTLKLEFTTFTESLNALERRVNSWLRSVKPRMDKDSDDEQTSLQYQIVQRSPFIPSAIPTKQDILVDICNSVYNLQELKPSGETVKLESQLQCHKSDNSSFDITQCMRVCLTLPLQIQASLVHSKVLDVLMHKMSLRNHLDLLAQVFLLGNGSVSSRLSDLIFSSHSSSIGLNTTNPKAPGWPPSSAKVLVATRSLLIDSIDSSYHMKSSHASGEINLLGNLGIAMSLDEEQPSISRRSLDALSFLRFGFRPPKPLDMIITDRSLAYYSRINQFLLILLRMTNVVDQLTLSRVHRTMRRVSQVAERFRIEATNFVRSFVAHVYETVMASNYSSFQRIMERNDVEIDRLRDAHQFMLEQICHGCFISRKMSEMHALIRTIFDAILAFSFISSDKKEENDADVDALYVTFHTNAKKFIAVLGGAEATGGSESFATGASVRFLMNDFWT